MAPHHKAGTSMGRSITAQWLCELHQANLDCARVFREACRVVDDDSVAALCEDLSSKRQHHAEELEEYLTANESEDHASIRAVVHRAWLDLRASFASDNPKAVLAEVLRSERRLHQGYDRAVAALAGSPVLGLIRRHMAESSNDNAHLGELHAAFTDDASTESEEDDL